MILTVIAVTSYNPDVSWLPILAVVMALGYYGREHR